MQLVTEDNITALAQERWATAKDPRTAQLLGVRDLPNRWEREIGHDDLVAPAAKVEAAYQRADRRRDRGHHRDLVEAGVD